MKIGFLGTGLMGQPMVIKLLQAEHQVTVYNRTKAKAQSLANAGATLVETPQDAIAMADCVILMLSNAPTIEELILSEKSREHLTGRTIIQMGTISPDQSQSIRDEVVAAEGAYLEAPVLGSIPQVKTGELIVMVGSTLEQFEQYQQLLQCYSPQPIYIGEVGTAAAMKLALNQLIAGLTSTFALSLSFVQRQGVDVEQFMSIVRESALYAPTFDKKLSRMCEGNFTQPNFPTKHLLKDTNLFLEQGAAVNLNTKGLAGIKQLIEQAIALGLGDKDYSAIYNAINQ